MSGLLPHAAKPCWLLYEGGVDILVAFPCNLPRCRASLSDQTQHVDENTISIVKFMFGFLERTVLLYMTQILVEYSPERELNPVKTSFNVKVFSFNGF